MNGTTTLGRTALHVAASRGHGDIIDKLLKAGIAFLSCKMFVLFGKKPVSYSQVLRAHNCGQFTCQTFTGADIEVSDAFGDSPLSIASKFNHKGCERQIFLFSWQQRAKKVTKVQEHPLFPHQCFDSAYPVWLKDFWRPQIYCAQLPQTSKQDANKKKQSTDRFITDDKLAEGEHGCSELCCLHSNTQFVFRCV